MSGSRLNPADGPLAEEHLGDRLSALVDGELGHEARERVLAHLATCTKCKTEADEQRRLKNVFAEVSAPPPSESFLARLQGLPGGDPDADSPRLGRGSFGASGVFDLKPDSFGYVPSGPHAAVLPPEQRGFRIHDMNRREAERSASRGLRLAAAAAGAVSLAAIALGGVSTGVGVDTTDARGGSGAGSNVTPARSTAGTSGTAGTDAQRRRSVAPLLAQGQRSFGNEGGAQTELSAPLLPGVPAPGTPAPAGQGRGPLHTLTTPVVVGAAAMSPLIRPFAPAPPVTLTAWSSGPEFEASVLSAVPSTVPSADPSVSPTPSSSG